MAKSQKKLGFIKEKIYIDNNIESSCNQPISPHMAYFQKKTGIIHHAPSQKYEKLKY